MTHFLGKLLLSATRWMVRIAPLVLFGLTWHLVCSAQLVNKDFLPSPLAVAAAFVDLFSGGEIATNLTITLFRAAVGLLTRSIRIVSGGDGLKDDFDKTSSNAAKCQSVADPVDTTPPPPAWPSRSETRAGAARL